MSQHFESAVPRDPPWLAGRGIGPALKWIVGTDGQLTSLCLSRETNEVFATDNTGAVYRIDRQGNIANLTRISPAAVSIVWSQTGSQGALIVGEDEVLRLDQSLKTLQKISLPDVVLGIAISPFGNHLAVSLAQGRTLIYNERGKKIAQFETLRPLSFLAFCQTEKLIFGAAEHGLICCHDLSGAEIWQERNSTNVGKLVITGEGDLVYTSSFAQGVQALDGDGTYVGSYVMEGTVHRLDVSIEPDRIIAATIEGLLYWLDSDGDQLWATAIKDQFVDVICDPLGEFAIIGLAESGIYRVDWSSSK